MIATPDPQVYVRKAIRLEPICSYFRHPSRLEFLSYSLETLHAGGSLRLHVSLRMYRKSTTHQSFITTLRLSHHFRRRGWNLNHKFILDQAENDYLNSCSNLLLRLFSHFFPQHFSPINLKGLFQLCLIFKAYLLFILN